MPKIFQCLYCDKKILGGTYTLIKHVEKHHKNESIIIHSYNIRNLANIKR